MHAKNFALDKFKWYNVDVKDKCLCKGELNMENLNTVNAVTEEVVTPQSTETAEVVETTEPSESVSTEVATVADEHKQSKEENAKFAEVRRKAEQEAIDKFISDQYGASHGIHTKAEYDAAIAKQKQNELLESLKSEDVNPEEIYQKMKENDPEFKEMKASKQEAFINSQISELNTDLKGLGLDVTINSLEDLVKLENSDSVIKYVEKGNTLSEAYFLANRNDIINKKTNQIQNDTIKKIEANGQASPGSLSDTGQTSSYFTEAQVDAMTQAEVNKNYDLIIKSMKSW